MLLNVAKFYKTIFSFNRTYCSRFCFFLLFSNN
nr:MAG TPA: hypothetical protein [Caudoviricetes sp.]DAY70596.1 MAG TPA: hypothetical protein [Caudoviricetes sp.]